MKIRNLLLALCGACAPALADVVQITLDSPQITAVPGQTITFRGVISNNDFFTVDLNDISVSLNGMFTENLTPFLSGPFTIAASTPLMTSKTPDFDFFEVTVDVPYTDPFGVKSGTLTILGNVEDMGGYDQNIQNPLGSITFSLNVVQPVPEPSTLALVLTGTALLFAGKGLIGAHSRRAVRGGNY
jgi:hypothetical protein